MVANQSNGPVRDHKGLQAALTKLKVGKDQKCVANLPEWKVNLQNAFVTHNLEGFLGEGYGKQVPSDQVGSILVNERVEERLSQRRKEYLAQAKEEKLLNEVTSKEVKVESKDGDGDPLGTPPTAIEMLTTHWPDIVETVRQNAQAEYEANLKKQAASAEKLGEHWGVLFLDPLTRVEEKKRHLNPRAVVSLGKKDKLDPFLYEVESQEARAQRMMAFTALKNTLSDLPKWVWKQVAVGNVYELYSLVVANFSESGRQVVIDDLTTRLANFSKLKSENFAQFVARFELLVSEITEADMDIDATQLVNSAEKAIINSGDKSLIRVYQMWGIAKGGSMTDPLQTFKEIKESMLFEEKKTRMSTKVSNTKVTRESALRAGTLPVKGSQNTSSGKKILGVCHYFQTARGCSHGDNCCFEHRKLGKKAAKELKTLIDSRRKERNSSAENTSAESSSEEEERKTPPSRKQSEPVRSKIARTKLTKEEISLIADELEQKAQHMRGQHSNSD